MNAPTLSGRVISAHGRHYMVELQNGDVLLCYPRGKRKDACVGDWVDIARQGETEASLTGIQTRKNLLHRSDDQRTKQFAANVDQLMVVVAGNPMFSEDLLGRALTGAWAASVDPIIVLNKTDEQKGLAQAHRKLEPYRVLGVDVIEISALDVKQARQRVLPRLEGKTTLLLGQSAMGKSTLLNALVPQAQAATQTHSVALGAGRHTTTATRLYHLPEGTGDLIDSPGVQTFGLAHLNAEDLEHGFPEFEHGRQSCRFYNCTHLHEPGCGVLADLKAGLVHPDRHALYQRLFSEKAFART
ncbi:ribosome small subunit-dependent GTPase A [Orrella marina]|uniref:Small ribosomal subunit biogenesis GTPase RsgA n=1 Tax=Orrella marina TaxID=2163011 RepID=A0A2R4XIC8_9BURK|nr:ribosome small subunit-dependent GTPase A [Orrella marina]AWB33566.1 ribosome small subunit-dependent GTPase A [Orrella marina]